MFSRMVLLRYVRLTSHLPFVKDLSTWHAMNLRSCRSLIYRGCDGMSVPSSLIEGRRFVVALVRHLRRYYVRWSRMMAYCQTHSRMVASQSCNTGHAV